VRAGYGDAFAELLDEDEKDRVTAIRLQQWQGAPDAGKWLDKAELKVPIAARLKLAA
jgi:hypothetical protein